MAMDPRTGQAISPRPEPKVLTEVEQIFEDTVSALRATSDWSTSQALIHSLKQTVELRNDLRNAR